MCAVGLWGDISAHLLTIPDLEEVCVEQKIEQTNLKKAEREKKKLAKANDLQSFEATIDSVINEAIGVAEELSDNTSLEFKRCYNCNLAWSSCTTNQSSCANLVATGVVFVVRFKVFYRKRILLF